MDRHRNFSGHNNSSLAVRIVLIAIIAAFITIAGLTAQIGLAGQHGAACFVYAETSYDPAAEPVDPFTASPLTTNITCVKKTLSIDNLG
ncbi:MAG: hypothetical protein IIY88_06690, partial [Eubacterium sp.]|nr:hypothetical protein [Eubacterium sp.]